MASNRQAPFPPIRNYDGRVATVENPARVDKVTGGNRVPIDYIPDNNDLMLPSGKIRIPTLGPFKHVK